MNYLLAFLIPLAWAQVMPGGRMKVDVNRDDVQKMATVALSMMNTQLGAQNSLTRVVEAHTQVVAGIKYYLKLEVQGQGQTQICDLTVWSRPWLNDNRLTEHHCSAKTRRALGMPGGLVPVDATKPEIVSLATFALNQLNSLENMQGTSVQVVTAKEQVVAGMKYYLTLRVTENGHSRLCDVEIFVQSWTSTKDVTHHTCHAPSKRAGMVGGVQPGQMTPEIRKVVQFAEDRINMKSNDLYREVAESVDHLTSQVVAGMKYVFDMHMVSSSCRNSADNMGKGIDICPINTNIQSVNRVVCHMEILSQAWTLTKYQVLSDNCVSA